MQTCRISRRVRVCLVAAPVLLSFLAFLSGARAQSTPASTATTLAVTTQSSSPGVTVAKLVATVQSAGSAVTVGSVEFFDGLKKIGSTAVVQSTAAGFTPGTAVIQKILGPGAHSLTAKFHPPLSLAASTSSPVPVTIPGSTTNTPALYPAGSYPLPDVGVGIAIVDVNGDGLPDILVPMLDLGQIQVFLNDPSNPGHFTQGTTITMPYSESMMQIAVGDVDGDGLPDLLVAVNGSISGDSDNNIGEVLLFLQNPAQPGTFEAPVGVLADAVIPNNFALIDMNGDGVPDIVFAGGTLYEGEYGHGVNVAIQSPTNRGTFVRASTFYASYATTNAGLSAAVADVNGDGLPDVVFSGVDNQIEVFYSDPSNPGGFASAGYSPAPMSSVYDSRLVDVDHDGHPDLIVSEVTAGIQIFRNDPSNPGNFLSPTTYTVPDRALSIQLGDINGDGIPDLIAAGFSNIFSTLPGDGTGSFGSPLTYTVNSPPGQIDQIAVADLDGDGLDDVVTLTGFYNYVTIPTFQINVLLHTPSGTKPLPLVELTAPSTSSLGESVTLSASVTSSFGSPTGTVTFLDGTQAIGTATLSGSGTAQISTSNLPAGDQQITAHYNGDSNFLAADSLASWIEITGLSPTLSLTASPTTGQAGTLFTFTLKASGSGPVPTGTIHFEQYQNGNLPTFATATLDSTGTATATLGTLTAGQYLIEAQYMGDGTYQPSSTQTNVTVTAGAAISLSASDTSVTPAGPVTFTAKVTNLPSLAGLPVSFFDYTTLVYSTTTDANGTATWQSPALTPGGHGITAEYLPANSGGDATSNEFFYSIPGALTSLAVSASPSSPVSGQAVTVSATITSSSGLVPSGSIYFTEDGSQIGSATLDASGTASITTAAQQPGSHIIVAVFNGNDQFDSTSNSVSFTIPTPDFSLTLDRLTMTVSAGQSGTVDVQLSPTAGFSGAVQLTCANLPAAATCNFSNANPTVTASGASSVLTISVSGTQASLHQPSRSRGWPLLAGLALMPFILRRRRSAVISLPCIAALSLLTLLAGCGGSSSATTPPPTSATLQVVGSSAGVTHSAYLSLTYN